MNLFPLTFEQITDICASLEDPEAMEDMIESLDQMEKNIQIIRQVLNGKLSKIELIKEETRQRDRRMLKKSLKLIKQKDTDEK